MKKFRWILIPLSLLILLTSYYVSLSINDNIRFFQNTNIIIINTTPYTFDVLADGRKVGTIESYDNISVSLGSGNSYGSKVAISIIAKDFAYTERIWDHSLVGKHFYIFTMRQDEYRIWVERN